MAMLRDTYPLFLLPSGDEPFGLRGAEITAPLYRHPEREPFEAAVMADRGLSQLFPEENETTGRHGTIHRSTGSGGSVQLAMLAQSLLKNGWELAAFHHESPSMRQNADGVLEVLELARDAIEGKQVSIPAIVGVAGLRLAASESVDLPWGKLRAITPTDETRIPPGLAGKLNSTTSDGKQIEIDYAGDLVMEFDVPYSVALGKGVKDGDWASRTDECRDC
jgi:DNA helicase HerA-like ATPase